jgi:hypothetical protein
MEFNFFLYQEFYYPQSNGSLVVCDTLVTLGDQ